jgi:hypothetical protein
MNGKSKLQIRKYSDVQYWNAVGNPINAGANCIQTRSQWDFLDHGARVGGNAGTAWVSRVRLSALR